MRTIVSMGSVSACLALACAGCGGGGPAPDGADAGPDAPDAGPRLDAGPGVGAPSKPLFDAYRELREAVRASPDHVARRAEDVVASGDPEAIFTFVRDEIAVYPAGEGRLGTLVNGARWGVGGTLRGGAGTPREQAEVLAYLYREAGFSARVVRGNPVASRHDTHGVFLRSHARTFEPALVDGAGSAWAAGLGIDLPGTTPATIDPGGQRAAELAATLAELAGPSSRPPVVTTWDSGAIPLVEVEIDGEPRLVSPMYPDAGFDETPVSGTVAPVEPLELPRVEVTLWALRTSAPGEPVVLVDGSWTAEELAGRRMSVGLTPAYDLPTLLAARLDEVQLFLPMIGVLDPDGDHAAALSRVGGLVTPGGSRIETTEDGEVLVDGRSVGDGAPAPDLEAAVASVEVEEIDASQFPQVTARVAVRDARGDAIAGLPPASFRVEEDGEAQTALMLQNRGDAPRVLLLFDPSTSMPDELRGEGAVALGLDLAAAIQAEFPAAQFLVASVSTGAELHGAWTTSLAALEGQLDGLQSFASNIYTALAEVMAAEPTLVVYLTDGQATDDPTEAVRDAVIAGARAVIVAAGDYDADVIDDLTELTGGVAVPVASPDEVVAPVLGVLEAEREAPYALRYFAPVDGPAERQVAVAVAAAQAAGTSYRPPAPEDRGPTGRWMGLHVTVAIGDEQVTRTIAGVAPDATALAGSATSSADVQAAFFATTVLAFEAAPPPPSVVLDDLLTEKLTLEPLFAAADEADAMVAAIEGGFVRSIGVPALIHALPSDGVASDHLTYESGLRVVATFERPHFDAPMTRHIDILPLSPAVSVSDDPAVSWRRTLEHTVRAAVVEEATYETSTLSLLEGESLIAVPAEDAGDVAGLDASARERWRRATDPYRIGHTVVMPADGEPLAFWIVDERTGAATAILPDGSGGGVMSDEEAELRRRIHYLEMLGKALSLARSPHAPWVQFYVTQAKIVAWISLIISNLGDPDYVPPEDLSPEELLKDAVCDLLDDAFMDTLPGDIGDLLGDVSDYYWLVSGGEDLLPSLCP